MKLIHILYKTVRIETGEYYIGVHGIDTDEYPRFNDGYLGSGNRMKASVKKYGAKAFRRSILEISESRDVIEALEKAMVTVEMIDDPLCLNLAPGGRVGVKGVPRGPMSSEHRQAISDAMKVVPSPKKSSKLSAEHRQAISDALKGGLKSPEHRQAISDSLKGRSPSVEHRQAISDAMKGGLKSPEHRQAISDAMKEWHQHRKQSNDSF